MATRRTPHCRICHKPLRGHSRELCNLIIDLPTPSAAITASRRPRTRKSAPLPSLSPQSSLILHNLLRSHSFIDPPPVSTPPIRRQSRGKRGVMMYQETLQDTLSRIYDEEQEKKADEEMETAPIPTDMVDHIKFEDPLSGASSSSVSNDIPVADLAIRNFLESMSNNPDNPPAALFSFPIDCIPSLQNIVQGHDLYMLICSLPNSKDGWVPIAVGRSLEAVGDLLEDGEKLALGLRRPDKFKAHEWDLGIRHIVVGALGGALATWAGLAYC